jgi:phospholipase/carboxylesterase
MDYRRQRNGTVIFPLALSALAVLAGGLSAQQPPTSGDVVFQGRSQTAIVKLPERFDTSRTYALLVALHGRGGTAAGLAPAFSSFAAVPILVAVPQGEYRVPGAGYSWFYLTDDRGLWAEHDTVSARRLLDLVTDIRARYRVGTVFVLGFSQGASMAYTLGLLHPEIVSGVLAVSGYPPEVDQEGSIVHAPDVEGARHVGLFIAHGRDDVLVGREVFTAQRDFFASRGYAVTSFEFDGGHQLTPALLDRVRRWILERLGS